MASEKKDGGGKFVISFLRQLDGKLCLGLDCGALNIGVSFFPLPLSSNLPLGQSLLMRSF